MAKSQKKKNCRKARVLQDLGNWSLHNPPPPQPCLLLTRQRERDEQRKKRNEKEHESEKKRERRSEKMGEMMGERICEK